MFRHNGTHESLGWPSPKFQERKNSPKRKVSGRKPPQTSVGHSRGYPGSELRSGSSKSWIDKHFGANVHDRRRRRPRPQGISKNFGQENLVDISDFFFFFWSGRGNGESEVPGGGVGFLIESPKGGAVSRTGGADGPEGCLQPVGGFGGGEAKHFFSGPKCPPRNLWAEFLFPKVP